MNKSGVIVESYFKFEPFQKYYVKATRHRSCYFQSLLFRFRSLGDGRWLNESYDQNLCTKIIEFSYVKFSFFEESGDGPLNIHIDKFWEF